MASYVKGPLDTGNVYAFAMASGAMTADTTAVRTVALQMTSGVDVAANLSVCETLLEAASQVQPQAVLLPENFAFLGPERDKRALAEDLSADGPISGALSGWARRFHTTLIAGGMPERSADPDRPFNSCVVYGPDGERMAVYRKLHLFDVELLDGTVLRESEATTGGDDLVCVDVAAARFGLSICYDLRFAELYRALAERGAQVLCVPAAFTLQTGKDHWRVLLRARAIENQTWVVAAAQYGHHGPGRDSYGHALICDPWGTVVAECRDDVGWISAELDIRWLERIRTSLPALKHRRPPGTYK